MRRNADVICEHKSDGTIIPLRFRVMDEDGEYQTFNVKGFRQVPVIIKNNEVQGKFIAANTDVFECMIEVFGMKKKIQLMFSWGTKNWTVDY